MRQMKIPKICGREILVTNPKPSKPLNDPKRYRPIPFCASHSRSCEAYLCLIRSNNQPSTNPQAGWFCGIKDLLWIKLISSPKKVK